MSTKDLSNPHERYIAEQLNCRTQIASGAIWCFKGDCISEGTLIECKATAKNYYILKESILCKIEKEALKINRVPLLAVRLNATTKRGNDFILYRVYDFVENAPKEFKEFNKSLKVFDLNNKVFKCNNTFWQAKDLEDFKEEFY